MKNSASKTLCVIGGGASGMACAIIAARSGFDVTILEHTDRLGKKILVTGNGKCNFTNQLMDEKQFYTDNIPFLHNVLAQFGTKEVLEFFDSLALCYKEKNGYYYPISGQSSSVLDVLRFELLKLNVKVLYNEIVTEVKYSNQKPLVETTNDHYQFDALVLACGGKAYPGTGSDGTGYKLCKKLGLKVKRPSEALVALKSPETYFKSIAGVRTDGKVSVFINDCFAGEEEGELQITDYGISGIPVFQISRLVSRAFAEDKKVSAFAEIDFFPKLSEQELFELIDSRVKMQYMLPAQDAFAGFLNKKLNMLMFKMAGVLPNTSAGQIKDKALKKMVAFCKHWNIPIIGTNDFSKCQVCAGGVLLDELTEGFACKKYPNIYVIGELTDVDGKCGGYNLHWAFASGVLAAKDAARRLL